MPGSEQVWQVCRVLGSSRGQCVDSAVAESVTAALAGDDFGVGGRWVDHRGDDLVAEDVAQRAKGRLLVKNQRGRSRVGRRLTTKFADNRTMQQRPRATAPHCPSSGDRRIGRGSG